MEDADYKRSEDVAPDAQDARVASSPLAPGLYLVSTPIGNADDLTLRALDLFARADVIACEDTRITRKLLKIHGVSLHGRRMIPYHDHNGAAQRPAIMARLARGESVVYASDAGTPLLADPGYRLAQAAIAAGFEMTAAPGASALLAALAVSGLPTDRFLFAGFAPPRSAARKRFYAEFAAAPATLIFYESPRRLAAALADMAEVFGDRPASVSRELTKKFEETRRGSLFALAEAYAEGAPPRGEIVVSVGPPKAPGAADLDPADLDAALRAALAEMRVKDAARAVADQLGVPRKLAYARALELTGRAG